MRYNQFGNADIKVSELCLGTMTWGRQNNQDQGHEQMDYALDAGINFFDTAEMYAVPPTAETYGKTEIIIGNWFASRKNRDKVILATKVAGPNIEWVRDGKAILDKKNIDTAIEGSLKRLQTDYIDLYQLHWPNRQFPHFSRHYAGMLDFTTEDSAAIEDNFLEVLTALDTHIKAGRIRYVGLSNETPWGISKYLQLAEKHGLPRMQSVQNEFSVLHRSDDPYVAEICAREDVAYLPWSPLGGGMLAGKYLNGARPHGTRWSLGDRYVSRDTDAAQNAVKAYMDLAQEHGLDVCQMVLSFVTRSSFVTSNIIGATSMEQLKSNIDSCKLDLSEDVLAGIDKIYRQSPIPF